MRNNIKEFMEFQNKMNLAMEIARKDAEEGVIGYDEDGQKLIDIDLLDKEKQALVP